MIGFKDVYLFDDTNIREREQFLNMYLNLTKILNIIVFLADGNLVIFHIYLSINNLTTY